MSLTVYGMGGTDTSPSVWVNSQTFITPAGTSGSLVTNSPTFSGAVTFSPKQADKSKTGLTPTQGISAKLLFKFVKSKLTKIEQEELKKKLSKLAPMLNYSKEMQQWAVYEDCAKKILEITREQEAALQGIEKIIQRKDVNKFVSQVRDRIVKFTDLSEFSRIIPKTVRKTLKNLQDKRVFDYYMILFTDITPPAEEVKSVKEKIKEKDPILFGVFEGFPDKLYYIADWEDEYCDLTLDKLVDKLTDLDDDYTVDEVPEITPAYVKQLKQEIKDKHARLGDARMSNYKDLMKKEDEDRERLRQAADGGMVEQVTVAPAQTKQNIFKRIYKAFKSI